MNIQESAYIRTNGESDVSSKTEVSVYTEIKKALKRWERLSTRLRIFMIFTGSIAIICSLSVTTFVGTDFNFMNDLIIKILAFLSALAYTIMTAYNLPNKANNARNAWRILRKAMFLYESKNLEIKGLIEAYHEGESVIGAVDFHFNPQNR